MTSFNFLLIYFTPFILRFQLQNPKILFYRQNRQISPILFVQNNNNIALVFFIYIHYRFV